MLSTRMVSNLSQVTKWLLFLMRYVPMVISVYEILTMCPAPE